MTCIKTQSMITPFINNKLSIKEMEAFLDHISSCPKCREELEFYYVLLTAMKQLDEDRNLSDDYELELSQKLESAQEKVIHAKYTYYRKKAILILIMILLAFFLSIRYANKSQENDNNITESDFRIRYRFQEERNQYMEWQLRNYLREKALENNQQVIPDQSKY